MKLTRTTTARIVIASLLTACITALFSPGVAYADARVCRGGVVEDTCLDVRGIGLHIDLMKADVTIGAGKTLYGHFQFHVNGIAVATTANTTYTAPWYGAKTFDSGWKNINKRFANNSQACAVFRYQTGGLWYTFPSKTCATIHS